MKLITKNLHMLALAILLFAAGKSNAQCNASFIWSNWAAGVVGFTSTSTPATSLTSYYWNFGNGNTYTATGIAGMGTSQTYSANGTYTVTLFILSIAPSCSMQVTQTVSVNNSVPSGSCNLNAGFSNYLTNPPGTMGFNNNSSGTVSATTYTWNYGDGSVSYGVNGLHTYTANGNYNVILTANNNTTPACVDSQVVAVVINNICNLNASYSYTAGANGNVSFLSTSTGTGTGYVFLWNFGDGGTATGPSVSHTYINGNFTAVLTVKNSSVAATCTSAATQTISVTTNTCNLSAGFTYSQSPGGLVNFYNNSTGTSSNTSYSWNFGNGTTSNSSGNPSTTYLNGGVHMAKLTIFNSSVPTCSSVVSNTLNITTVSCTANPNFTMVYGGTPGYWNVIPTYPYNVVNARWTWGDGAQSFTLFTSHQYSATGNYNICLTVTVSCGATASACSTYSVYRSAAATIYYINVIEPASKSVDTGSTVGIAENQSTEATLNLYPNPASGEFALMAQGISGNNTRLIITDALGREIVSAVQYSSSGKIMEIIDLHEHASGIYFVTIQNDQQSLTKKLVLTK